MSLGDRDSTHTDSKAHSLFLHHSPFPLSVQHPFQFSMKLMENMGDKEDMVAAVKDSSLTVFYIFVEFCVIQIYVFMRSYVMKQLIFCISLHLTELTECCGISFTFKTMNFLVMASLYGSFCILFKLNKFFHIFNLLM